MTHWVNDVPYETEEEAQAAWEALLAEEARVREQEAIADAEWDKVRPLNPTEVLTAILASTDVAESIPDEAIARMAPYFAEWDGDGVSYTTGTLASYQDVVYRCLQDHTAQSNWAPDISPSLWAKVLIPDPEVIPEWEQPGSTNPYMKGDKVTHNGSTWESDIDNNIWEPGVYGWHQI